MHPIKNIKERNGVNTNFLEESTEVLVLLVLLGFPLWPRCGRVFTNTGLITTDTAHIGFLYKI